MWGGVEGGVKALGINVAWRRALTADEAPWQDPCCGLAWGWCLAAPAAHICAAAAAALLG